MTPSGSSTGSGGDLARGIYIDPAGGRTLFRDYAKEWRAGQIHRASTATQAESYLRLHAYPTLGRRPLGAIRRSEVQAWVKTISANLAPGSVEVTYRWVSSIFKAAVADRLIAASPCHRIALPKRTDTEVIPLAVDEVEALAAAVPARYRALIVFAAGMGLRQGECFGLSVDRVDFLRRTVRVDRQLTSVRDGIPVFGPPKLRAPSDATATGVATDGSAGRALGPGSGESGPAVSCRLIGTGRRLGRAQVTVTRSRRWPGLGYWHSRR